MTTEKEISEQIQQDYNRFWHSPYDAQIPEGFMFRFRSALMFHTAKSLQGSIPVIKELIGKKDDDLKFFEVGVMINTIFAVPFNAMYDSPEQAMDALAELHEIELKYNELVDKRSKVIEKKRAKLLEICGHTGKTIPLNGTKN